MKSLDNIIDEFAKLPGIGRKSAMRIAFHVLEMEDEELLNFITILKEAKEKIKKCEICGNLTENDICEICSDEERDSSIICIVKDSRDIIAFEKSKTYNGLYHVLGGIIDPLNGIGVDDLDIDKLTKRLTGNVKEVILALDPSLEGETTSLYLSKIIKEKEIIVSRIASGIPMGGNIEFSDIATLSRSLEGRKEI
ncbi:Recombination protein RecR [Sebaldella termitidis]|jgi:recombination protein RecR|uniref:Recombination protein RecR n=1 Tax=Sebaldella termitidis (strain ATCC 33386 / NCTC 11300) TaxID=526218 RepID=D1AIJ3_SEBTE|nr:recombination mediator RecR [Sebaldella termitidis]ACZ08577.1 recombination protein RecR [Sebaldella termitidis ATCC 33386]SUI23892.1 Recombination protein RecR [Sebaldella termitidis]